MPKLGAAIWSRQLYPPITRATGSDLNKTATGPWAQKIDASIISYQQVVGAIAAGLISIIMVAAIYHLNKQVSPLVPKELDHA
jgi:hypothetical protein